MIHKSNNNDSNRQNHETIKQSEPRRDLQKKKLKLNARTQAAHLRNGKRYGYNATMSALAHPSTVRAARKTNK